MHKDPFVPVARAWLYLLSLGKQEVPGGPLCYDNSKSLSFLPEAARAPGGSGEIPQSEGLPRD